MTMTEPATTELEAHGEDALERVQRMLEAADIDPDDVSGVRVEVIHGGERARPEDTPMPFGEAAGTRPDEEPDQEDDRVEHGPVEPDPFADPRGGGGAGGMYDGDYPADLFEGEAIRPDSQQGRVLRLMSEEGGWFHRSDLADELDDLDVSQVSDALSKLFRDYGWVKRRRMDPQPDKKGVQREYATTEAGRGAAAEGVRRARSYADDRDDVEGPEP